MIARISHCFSCDLTHYIVPYYHWSDDDDASKSVDVLGVTSNSECIEGSACDVVLRVEATLSDIGLLTVDNILYETDDSSTPVGTFRKGLCSVNGEVVDEQTQFREDDITVSSEGFLEVSLDQIR